MNGRSDFQEHYRQIRESDRLGAGPGLLEFARTTEIIQRHVPFPAKVLDVGGGPGAYAMWLLQHGCDVDLIDPVQHHIDQALQRFDEAGLQGTAQVGDARSLTFEDDHYDAVLLLGPLYHLTEPSDRIQALAEARRVVRKGGVIFVAAISRFASLLDGFSRQLVRDPEFVGILEQDLVNGQHRNPGGNPQYFTTAYFHTPADLIHEISAAMLELEALIGVEGPFWCMGNFDELWHDPALRQLVLDTLRKIELEPSLLGA
ncbi:MAG TPA: methyltransferase domain-containing protein, partial [Longimicrobiales bacterium]